VPILHPYLGIDLLTCRGEPRGPISAPMFGCRFTVGRCGSKRTGGAENALPPRNRVANALSPRQGDPLHVGGWPN